MKKLKPVIAMLLCMLWFIPPSMGAESQRVTVNVTDATLRQLFKAIEDQSSYHFSFDSKAIDNRADITIKMVDQPVGKVLDTAFKGRDLQYSIVSDKSIVVSVNKQASKSSKTKRTITGTVVDADNEPVIGATIRVPETGGVTLTDINGNYSIEAPENATVEVSYIGTRPAKAKAKGEGPLNFTMTTDENLLDEVVVVGYGQQAKINLTGSVSTVSSKDLASRPITSVQAGIQGLMPGLTITNSQGRPGENSSSLRVRGTGTLNNSSPYILIDGVESGSLDMVDPNDISSISVLKDAASAAIYGSKAANGVILITTKRGEEGRSVVSYNGSFGWQRATGLVERMSSYDAATYYNNALAASNKSLRFSEEDLTLFKNGNDPYGHPNTDWRDLCYSGSGFIHQHNASVTGGTNKARYMLSAGYLGQDGIIRNSDRSQFNLRTNLDINLSDKFSVKGNMAFIHNNYADPTNSYVGGGSDQIIRQVNIIAPWITYRYEDGTYGTIGDGNPIAWLDLDQQYKHKIQNFTGTLALNYNIIDDLKFTAQGSYISNSNSATDFVKDIQYNSTKYHGPNRVTRTDAKWDRYTADLLLNYSRIFADKHDIKVLLGYNVEKYNYDRLNAYREGFANNELTDINAGTSSTQTNSGYTRELAMMSYFGRVNYVFDRRYLFEANFRADGSSRFSPDNRWGYYPSFSAAWRLSEESFMESSRDWLQSLKIRGSWGQLGNQEALDDFYPWLVTYAIGMNYPFGGQLNSGIAQTSQKLSTISWEKSTTWGIGFDASFLNSINLSLEYYNRKTTGIIMDVPVPGSFGLSAYKDNVGAMRNTGIELTLGYNNQWGDWRFSANGNFAYNHNEIINLGGVTEQISTYTINRVGEAYQSYYGYVADGFFQTQEEADEFTAKYGNPFGSAKAFKAGDLRYKDVNGDGKLTSADRDVLSADQPKFTFGLNLNASYKYFDVSMLLQGTCGVGRYFNQEVFGEFIGDNSHPATAWFDAWSENNRDGYFPRIIETEYSASYPNTPSSHWIFNTNYLRFKNIQVGYTLPSRWLERLGISRARIYYSGENLFTIDNLPVDVDPESPSGRASHYPQVKTNSFGLNLTF